MKVYIYARTSTGEEAAALDLVKLFVNETDARMLMQKDYEEVKATLEYYEMDEDYQDDNQWELRIIDDNTKSGETTFRGFLQIEEL